ncbi:MAG: hypothetical protein HOC70_00810, partial [Gammaproteobacteria bacterium]|nr:hypothetical protein [Gammaproteobacteria bacterium]
SYPGALGIDRYGIFDEIENYTSFATFGHFGMGHSPTWDVYIPLLTPAVYHSARVIDDRLTGKNRQQQVWMRRTVRPPWLEIDDYYGAKDLVSMLNSRTSDLPHMGLDTIFIAHDNKYLPDQWGHEQSGKRVLFPMTRNEKWKGQEYHDEFKLIPIPKAKYVSQKLFKHKNDEPPQWAKDMEANGGQARVERINDIADSTENGFMIVNVFADGRPTETKDVDLPSP